MEIKKNDDVLKCIPASGDLLRSDCKTCEENEETWCCKIFSKKIEEHLAGEMLKDGFERIEVDLSRIEKIDSCGISALVLLKKMAKKNNLERICLQNFNNDYVQKVLDMVQIDEIMEIKQPLKT